MLSLAFPLTLIYKSQTKIFFFFSKQLQTQQTTLAYNTKGIKQEMISSQPLCLSH